jgi:hypothetical protein
MPIPLEALATERPGVTGRAEASHAVEGEI